MSLAHHSNYLHQTFDINYLHFSSTLAFGHPVKSPRQIGTESAIMYIYACDRKKYLFNGTQVCRIVISPLLTCSTNSRIHAKHDDRVTDNSRCLCLRSVVI